MVQIDPNREYLEYIQQVELANINNPIDLIEYLKTHHIDYDDPDIYMHINELFINSNYVQHYTLCLVQQNQIFETVFGLIYSPSNINDMEWRLYNLVKSLEFNINSDTKINLFIPQLLYDNIHKPIPKWKRGTIKAYDILGKILGCVKQQNQNEISKMEPHVLNRKIKFGDIQPKDFVHVISNIYLHWDQIEDLYNKFSYLADLPTQYEIFNKLISYSYAHKNYIGLIASCVKNILKLSNESIDATIRKLINCVIANTKSNTYLFIQILRYYSIEFTIDLDIFHSILDLGCDPGRYDHEHNLCICPFALDMEFILEKKVYCTNCTNKTNNPKSYYDHFDYSCDDSYLHSQSYETWVEFLYGILVEAPNIKTLKLAIKTRCHVLFNNICKSGIDPDQECLRLACKPDEINWVNLGIIEQIYNYKLFFDYECFTGITSSEFAYEEPDTCVNILIAGGLKFDDQVINHIRELGKSLKGVEYNFYKYITKILETWGLII